MLSVEVSDNGRGVSADDLAKARSFGIRGLRERAATVGGWVDLSSDGGGTTLILSVPVAARAARAARETARESESDGESDSGFSDTVFDVEGHDPSAWDER